MTSQTTPSPRPLRFGELMRAPSPDARQTSQVGRFMTWAQSTRGLSLPDWDALWRWSVSDLEGFWGAVWDYFTVRSDRPYTTVLAERRMPGARWFPGAALNYAEHCMGRPEDAGEVAVLAYSQTRPPVELSFGDLQEQVRRARAGLRALGVRRGDVVVAYLPNIPETLVAFLATASLGAVWATCAPEFGTAAVLDRFGQVDPKVLLAVDGYGFGAKRVDRREAVADIRAGLPTLEHVVSVPYAGESLPGSIAWDELLAADPGILEFEPVPFDHPLYVLFSSGTTGIPKAIVHGHGGILLEHLKNHAFHWDLGPGDRLQWFTTTAWMMWNAMVSTLLVRAAMVMIDGDPVYPDLHYQWALAEQTRTTLMGLSPAYLHACRRAGLVPAREHDLSRVRQYGVVGSPLPLEGYQWVRDALGTEALLNVGSGGTDVCTGLVHGSPMQPVWAGEMSGPGLAVDAKAFSPEGKPVVGELGELVLASPMPSMPVGFWGDPDGRRYRAAYFEHFPGVWRHGDWIRFQERGSCVITGRSDATLNRGGVRLGTADFYRALDDVAEVGDSLVVHLEDPEGGAGQLLLFVTVPGGDLDEALTARIRAALRNGLSPRHVPDAVRQVPAIPYNRTGKKLEVPVKRILQGGTVDAVASRESLADPTSLDAFEAIARQLRA